MAAVVTVAAAALPALPATVVVVWPVDSSVNTSNKEAKGEESVGVPVTVLLLLLAAATAAAWMLTLLPDRTSVEDTEAGGIVFALSSSGMAGDCGDKKPASEDTSGEVRSAREEAS